MLLNNPHTMKNIILSISFFIITSNAFSQSKEFINSLTPIYPGCENSTDKSKCFSTAVGNLIIAEFNKNGANRGEKIQIELLIRSEIDGKSSILRIKNNDAEVIKLAKLALEKLPLIKPLKSQSGKNVTSSKGFFVTLVRNKKENKYELLN